MNPVVVGGVAIRGGAGSVLGVWLFTWLKRIGQIELTISVLYVLLLGTLGFLMMIESVRSLLRQRRPGGVRRKLIGEKNIFIRRLRGLSQIRKMDGRVS